jgi:(p)ppGpp synthase/HD superfamily hydrolase
MIQLVLPPLRRTSADAAQFAAAVHADETDRTGAPLMAHLARVATSVARLAEGCPFWSNDHRDDAMQVAWLHHATRKGKVTARSLRRESFSRIVIDDVVALTKDSSTTYNDWLEEIALNADLTTILVKLADLEDNSTSNHDVDLFGGDVAYLDMNHQMAIHRIIEAARSKGWEGGIELLSGTQ